MEVLNANSLTNAMKHCRDYPQYQAVIVINDHTRLQEFLKGAKTYIQSESDEHIHSLSRAGVIKFKNGSHINSIMADSRARGLCANEIIFLMRELPISNELDDTLYKSTVLYI